MKRIYINTLLLCAMSAFLTTQNPLHAEAATITPVTARLSSQALTQIPEEYMPHVDAFTFAADNIDDMPEANPYINMIVADVADFVNVRSEPNTEAGITGRIYGNAVAEIIKFSPVDDSWIEIESGEVTGYVKAEYFLVGNDAVTAIETQTQNGGAMTYARSMDEILAEIAAQEEALRQERDRAAQEEAARAAAESQSNAVVITAEANANTSAFFASTATDTTSDTTADSELRQSIVDFALQYVGNPYVHGGNSLTTGTDCSGFTSLVFAEFGFSLSRTPSGQLTTNGTKIEYSEIQPGDIICYTSNGTTCTHVALYIGDGQIVHAANSKKGIITNNADYSTIIGVKNIID